MSFFSEWVAKGIERLFELSRHFRREASSESPTPDLRSAALSNKAGFRPNPKYNLTFFKPYPLYLRDKQNLKMLLEINWNVNPQIFKIGEFEIRYYGLLFALGFIIGQRVLVHIFKKEGKPESDVDTLTMYMVLATVIGARVGHYVFYEYHAIPQVGLGPWLLEMIKPPYSGLASHGAILSIFPALYFYARHKKDQSYLWITDRMAITVAIAGFCIRLGNFMNSEILGKPSNVPWAVNFMQDSDYLRGYYPLTPRHPAQLYESLSCLVLFFIMFAIWNKYKAKTPTGLLTGLFMIWVFTLRFFYEFLKENQTVWEQGMTLNTGQLLSIPAVLFGLAVWYFGSRYDKKKELENNLS